MAARPKAITNQTLLHPVKQTISLQVNQQTLIWVEIWGEKALQLQAELVEIMNKYNMTE